MKEQHKSIGDTVKAAKVFSRIDETLAAHFGGNSQAVQFCVEGRNGMTRREAETWVQEACADGFSVVRYVVSGSESDILVVDLAAIRPIENVDATDP